MNGKFTTPRLVPEPTVDRPAKKLIVNMEFLEEDYILEDMIKILSQYKILINYLVSNQNHNTAWKEDLILLISDHKQ